MIGGITGTPGHVTVTPVYWAPAGYLFSATYQSIIDGYLRNVAMDSQKSTNVFSVATQYYQQDTTANAPLEHIDYVVTAATDLLDRSSYPAQGACVPATGYTACVTDAQVQAELTKLGVTADDSHAYAVLFPPGVETCEPSDSKGVVKCSASDFCAYHSSSAQAPYLIYANLPYPDPKACGDPNGAQAPNGDAVADTEVSLFSHETNEIITDWAGAWMDTAGYENGDECAFVYGQPLGSIAGAGTAYNQVVGTGKYYTQDEFSNEDYTLGIGDSVGSTKIAGCVQREELPTAAFSVAPVSSDIASTFDGSASTDSDGTAPLGFNWTWGDGSPNGAGVKPSHTYCSPGNYTVTLTVTDDGGWQASTTQSIAVAQGPPIVSTVAPTSGPASGGTQVSIAGCSLTGTTSVKFGTVDASSFTVASDRQVNATTPTEAPGSVDVTVTTASGTSATSPYDSYSFVLRVNGGGALASGPGAAAPTSTSARAFAEGLDGQVWQNVFNGQSFSGWSSLGGAVTADPAAVSWGSNRVDLFARGTDNAIWHRYWNGTTWSTWQGLGGGIQYGPSAASWSQQRLDIFVIGLDNQLWHRAWDGTIWWPWEALGGYLTSSPAAVSWGPNRIDVFARGGDNQLWHLAWTGAGWSAWEAAGGLFQSGPGVASCAAGHLDVFGVGLDGQVWRKGWNGSAWSPWQPLGGQWTSDPAAACLPGGNTITLFARGGDNALWEQSVTGT